MNFLIAVKPSLPDTGTALHLFLPGLFAIGNSLPERVCPALKGSLLVHPAPIVRKEDAVKIILFFQRDKVIETVIDFSAVDINKLSLSQSKEIGEILDLTLRKENVTRFLRAAIKTTLTLESVIHNNKKTPSLLPFLEGDGERRIRTFEGRAVRFTV